MKVFKKHFTIVNLILILAASFAAYNFGLAGGYIEGTHFSIGGLLAGVVVNLSLVIGASKFGSVKGKNRTKQATVSLIALLVLSPAIVSPVIYYKLPDTFLTSELRIAWSIGWPLVADIAIVVAGAVAGKGLVQLSTTQSDASATHKSESASRVQKSATQSVVSASGWPRRCEHCNAQVPDSIALLQKPQSKGAHMKKHHPELCETKKIVVDPSLLIKKE